ncbi:MAG: hypothetical protein Q4C20_01325 [Erysipelotrichaceae bacterium]|nr:hypothetical protein [Erysipelotrichaceae bacterium]
MKKVFLSAIAALFLVTGCSTAKTDSDDKKDPETAEEINAEDIDTMQVEEETDIDTEEGDATEGL